MRQKCLKSFSFSGEKFRSRQGPKLVESRSGKIVGLQGAGEGEDGEEEGGEGEGEGRTGEGEEGQGRGNNQRLVPTPTLPRDFPKISSTNPEILRDFPSDYAALGDRR